MKIQIGCPENKMVSATLQIGGSKSETNRLLLLKALFPAIEIDNASDSDDSHAMKTALASSESVIDIHHAGTAMRFLTAYFASRESKEIVLTGSQRMKQRPIKILVAALRELSADINYIENEGFPPIRISGKKLSGSKVHLNANVSSQYITALLLIGATLENGLELNLEGTITSVPYIQMTLSLLHEAGIRSEFIGNKIKVFPVLKEIPAKKITVESDWSSASYLYSIVALSEVGSQISLSYFKSDSFQGDRELSDIYNFLGVETQFFEGTITITKTDKILAENLQLDLNRTPDIAQTLAVSCFGLGIGCELIGLHTLKIKETDRLQAIKNEIEKLGGTVDITNDSLRLHPNNNINSGIAIATYDDHRMAMAFAPLGLMVPIVIKNAEVVSKSYPNFWQDIKTIGFSIKQTD